MAIFFSERKRKGSAAAGGISFSCATKTSELSAIADGRARQCGLARLERIDKYDLVECRDSE